MQKIVLIGHGNVGKEVEKVLLENGFQVDSIIRSSGIQNPNIFDEYTTVFISVPSRGNGDEMAHYYTDALERGANVVTCEKAVLANHWNLTHSYPGKIKYSATVGGDSGMLPAISDFKDSIASIYAVVNGTLNYISQELADGKGNKDIYKEVTEKGYAEPGAADFDSVIENELQDVAYKTAILANHSTMLPSMVAPADITLRPLEANTVCAVRIKEGNVEAGFIPVPEGHHPPAGVNNILYINEKKIAEGPGAGARATASRMFKDFLALKT